MGKHIFIYRGSSLKVLLCALVLRGVIDDGKCYPAPQFYYSAPQLKLYQIYIFNVCVNKYSLTNYFIYLKLIIAAAVAVVVIVIVVVVAA
jgi:hypothetical protein